MSKSLVIDFIVLEKLGISYDELLYLHWLYKPKLHSQPWKKFGNDNLADKNYIKIDSKNVVHLRQEAIDLLEYFSIDSFKVFEAPKIIKKSKKKIVAEVMERVEEYRRKWQGRKPGAMGGKQSCIDKLSRWMDENPTYSFDDVLRAADIYLSTEGLDIRYLQRADFFIYKQENNREESSRLSAYIDEVDEKTTADWTSTLN